MKVLQPASATARHEPFQISLAVLIVDADAALDGDRHRHPRPHRRHAARDEIWLRHQAGAEASLLYPVRGAADVEVDLVVAEALADGGGLREPRGIGAAELQGDRVLFGVEGKQPLAVPVQDRLRRHHLRVEPRAAREQPMEEPAVPIRPVHHRGDAEFGGRVSHSLRISGVG